jgi:heptosyltransferase-2
MSRVAVIQTAFPGDVILCTPIFESLKSAGHETVAVVRPQAEPLLWHNPYIDEIIAYDKKGGVRAFLRAAYQLRQADCDTALIIQRYLKSALLPIYAGIDTLIGFNIAQVSSLYTGAVHYDGNLHEVERCLALCEGLSPVSGFAPKIFTSDNDLNESRSVLSKNQINPDNFIAMAPGSVWATKRWVGYKELAELLRAEYDYDIALLGSEQDFDLCEQIASGTGAKNMAGKTDLLQSSAIIQLAKLAVTNDSAPAHIAAAVGTPVVDIFGPTVPEFGFTPYTDKKVIIENKGLYCRPCSKHGPMKCPEGHFRCMKEIAPERVMRACGRLIEKHR